MAGAGSRAVAGRYAKALLQVALEKKADPERLDQELQEFAGLLTEHPRLQRTLGSPAIFPDKRVSIVDALLTSDSFSPYTRNLLRVMAVKQRIALLHEVREQYRRALDAQQKIASAKVTSAHPLSEAQKRALAERLSELTGKTMRLHFETDPDILGGLVVRIGNRIYDASVVTQLRGFKERALAGL